MKSLLEIAQRKGGEFEIVISEDVTGRLDAKISDTPDATVFIIGHPHRGAEGWVDCEYVIKAFSKKGIDFIHDVHGYFLILIFEKGAYVCHIFLDRFGGYKIFSSQSSDVFILSDNITQIASHLPSLTVRSDSFFELVNFGFIFGDKTLFSEIKRLRCGVTIRLERAKEPEITRYWHPLAGNEPGEVNEAQVMGAFNYHFKELFEISNRASLSLTGGLDSRAILSACLPFRNRTACFTYGDKTNADVRLASEICALSKVRHRHYPLEGIFIESFPQDIEEGALETNGLVNYVLSTNLKHVFAEESTQSEVLLTGIGPDLYRAYAIKTKKDEELSGKEMLKFGMLRYRTAWASEILVGIDEEEQIDRSAETLAKQAAREFEDDKQGISFQTWGEYVLARDRTSNYTTHLFAPAAHVMKIWDCWLFLPLVEMSLRVAENKRLSDFVPRYIISKNEPLLCLVPSSKGGYVGLDRPPLRVKSSGMRIKAFDLYRKGANSIERFLFKKGDRGSELHSRLHPVDQALSR